MDDWQDKPEDPRKKRLEEEEKKRKRFDALPSWAQRNSFLKTILIDKIKWCDVGQFPVGMVEWMDAREPAIKLIDEATGYLKGLEPTSGLPDEHIEELRGRIAALERAANRETHPGIYYCIVDIEEKTKNLSMLLQRARADAQAG